MTTQAHRGIAAIILSAGIVIAVVAALVRVFPELPPPAGSFAVGTTRCDPEGRGAAGSASETGRCSVTLQFWYPAEPGTGVGPAPYDWGDEGLLSAARWVKPAQGLTLPSPPRRRAIPSCCTFPNGAAAPSPTPLWRVTSPAAASS
jgi:hypothetical protein